jgi:hypothetical protein
MTVTQFLADLARQIEPANPRLAERIRTAACATAIWEEADRVRRRDQAEASDRLRPVSPRKTYYVPSP